MKEIFVEWINFRAKENKEKNLCVEGKKLDVLFDQKKIEGNKLEVCLIEKKNEGKKLGVVWLKRKWWEQVRYCLIKKIKGRK